MPPCLITLMRTSLSLLTLLKLSSSLPCLLWTSPSWPANSSEDAIIHFLFYRTSLNHAIWLWWRSCFACCLPQFCPRSAPLLLWWDQELQTMPALSVGDFSRLPKCAQQPKCASLCALKGTIGCCIPHALLGFIAWLSFPRSLTAYKSGHLRLQFLSALSMKFTEH